MCAEAVTTERAVGSPAARRSVALLAAGAVPLAAGRLMPLDGTEVDGPALVCPFRAATGIPCPLCGGMRAIALAAQGDGRFLSYGAVWVAVALTAAVVGIAGLVAVAVRPRRSEGPPFRPAATSRRVLAAGAAVVAIAWAWAIAHQDSIAEA